MKRAGIGQGIRHHQYIIYIHSFREHAEKMNDISAAFIIQWFISQARLSVVALSNQAIAPVMSIYFTIFSITLSMMALFRLISEC